MSRVLRGVREASAGALRTRVSGEPGPGRGAIGRGVEPRGEAPAGRASGRSERTGLERFLRRGFPGS